MERLRDDVRERLLTAIGSPHRRRELHELGLRDHDLRRLVRNDLLQVVRKQYLDGALDPDLAKVVGAQKAYPRSVISHFTAATLTGLRTWTDTQRPGRPHPNAIWLTRLPGTKRNQKRDDLMVRRAGLTAQDLAHHNGLLVTSAARTVVDLARELPLREAMVTIDHALAVATSRGTLQEVLERQRRWPGIGGARPAVMFGDPRSESALESIARVVFAEVGLPEPILQAQFWDGSRWMPERVDFWWPQFRTVAEADGLAKYEAPTAAERRRLQRQSFVREQRLSDRNIEIVRFGWEDVVQSPAELCERIGRAFRRGQRRTGEPPTWTASDPHDPDLWPQLPTPDDPAAF